MIKVYFDGACSENGRMDADTGIGYWAHDEDTDKELFRVSEYGGKGTNNTAEYKALIKALEKLIELGVSGKRIIVQGDSQLVIKQVFGGWKCNHDHLIKLRDQAWGLIERLGGAVKGEWIPREQNAVADSLSKEGIKKGESMTSEMVVIDMGDGIFKVTSGSSGKSYAVDLNNKVCSCPDNQYRKNECKHLRYIKHKYASGAVSV